MVKFIYGLNVASKKEDLPQAARDTADHMDKTLAIGYRSIPFIHLLPSLIPNCEFSRVQKQIRETVDMLREGPFDAAEVSTFPRVLNSCEFFIDFLL